MSGTEAPGLRPDTAAAGVVEQAIVSSLIDAPDTVEYEIHEHAVLKKFDARPDGREWTNEEINAGEADGYLSEVITLEDGVIVDTWRREDDGEGVSG